MKFTKNRIAAIAIAIFLMLSMSASMMLLPSASAHTPPWTIKPWAYISLNPNPVGVGQQVTVYMWLDQIYDLAALGNDYRFHNYELTITSPTGTITKQTFADISDPTSDQYTLFTPSEVGTYTFNFTFPGQVVNDYPHDPTSLYVNDTYLPATASTTLTVQKTPIPAAITGEPLPTEYWTRPIFGENTNWYSLASNWLGDGAPGYAGVSNWDGENLNPQDCIGSQTAHIMWTKPLDSGGVVGGNETAIPGNTYFEGSAYNNRYSNPIIMDGMIYYQAPLSFYAPGQSFETAPGQSVSSGTFCVNLQTGQQIWESTTIPTPLNFGYIYDIENPDQHGVLQPILFAGVFMVDYYWGTGTGNQASEAFDADTGNWLFNITNWPIGAEASVEPSGNGYVQLPAGPNGEILNYVVTNGGTDANPNYYLAEWNSSRMWQMQGGIVGWPTVDASASTMYDWNISIPFANTMPSIYQQYDDLYPKPFTIIGAYYNDILICRNGTLPCIGQDVADEPESNTPYTYFAINLNATVGPIGKVLWWYTLNPPAGNMTVIDAGCDPVNRVFIESYEETGQWVGYSMDTGQKLWGPVGSMTPLNYYGNPDDQIAYGKLYACGFGGIIYCYDDKTGNLLWTYGNGGEGNSTYGGLNVPYGFYPTFIQAIGNGVVYTVTTEHTVETPIYKGALARAINATSGKEIWTLPDYTGEFIGPNSYAMADGYNTWFNGYDNQIYTVGRGPSETTVNAPNIGVTTATPIMITGTVMDISAGTTQTEQAADFPHGVPCASDASMSTWMSYVYQQQAEPSNFTGVPVTITETDVNHNTYTIGTTTTDESGTFAYNWTPPIQGNYTIVASFAGSGAYWGSCAETHIYASAPAPTAAPTASPPTGLATMSALTYGIVAVIIVIIIIGAVIVVLLLRKRP